MPQRSHEWDGFIHDGRIDKPLRADPDYIKRFEYEAQTIAQDDNNGVRDKPGVDRCNGRQALTMYYLNRIYPLLDRTVHT